MTTNVESTHVNQGEAFAPSPTMRRWIGIGIAAFLLVQTLIPLSYYWNDEPTSERFSWRMFSSVDLSTWDTQITELVEQGNEVVEQQVPIHAELQETYVKAIQRAQFDIVEAFMRQRAEQTGVKEVRFLAQGRFPSGKLMDPIQLSVKPGGELTGK